MIARLEWRLCFLREHRNQPPFRVGIGKRSSQDACIMRLSCSRLIGADMRRVQTQRRVVGIFAVFLSVIVVGCSSASAQSGGETNTLRSSGNPARPVIIPLTIRVKGEATQSELELQSVDLTVNEDGDSQTILSIRAMGTSSPINLIVLIQDDLVPSIGLEIKSLAEFIRRLPRGSRVSIGYLRTGSLQVRQKFTSDLEKVAKSLSGPIGVASDAPYNAYVEVIEALKRFDAQPAGRRAILLVSDGLDTSHGVDSSGPTQSLDLQRAINEAQRRSVAISSFYAPTALTGTGGTLIGNAQRSLQRVSA